jgi:ubiquitin-protein ligase
MNPIKRVAKELSDFKSENNNTIIIEPIDNNLKNIMCTIIPDESSIYNLFEDRKTKLQLIITISDDYPFSPPKVKFSPTIFHPNVFAVSGDICLDILKDAWTPALTISRICLSILSLLDAPNTSDPINAVAAELYDKDKDEYKNKIKEWYLQKYN